MIEGRPPHVVLPLLTFVPGGMGGSETYVRAVVERLGSRDDLQVTCLLPANAAGLSPHVREITERRSSRPESGARVAAMVRALRPSRRARDAVRDADVVHHPFTVPVPFPSGPARVITLLDVQHHDLPTMFSGAERAFRRYAYDGAARSADRVITLSEFCRDRIVARLGIERSRVVVAHLGVDPSAFVRNDGPRDRFILYPARDWPHKNHQRLIAAMALARRELPGLRLVLTGGDQASYGVLPDWLEHRGQVSSADLRALYHQASAMVFPSLYEGFGLPPLEAMASGCPVAAAAAGSLPEVCGDAAVMFDPLDVVAIARGIVEAVSGRERLVPLGLEQVQRFTWDSCADVHARVYASAARRYRS